MHLYRLGKMAFKLAFVKVQNSAVPCSVSMPPYDLMMYAGGIYGNLVRKRENMYVVKNIDVIIRFYLIKNTQFQSYLWVFILLKEFHCSNTL